MLLEGHCVPNTLEKVQKVVRDLGLDYQKIHACVNDCVLFRKEYAEMDTCPACGESRWKTSDSGEKEGSCSDDAAPNRRIPQKIGLDAIILTNQEHYLVVISFLIENVPVMTCAPSGNSTKLVKLIRPCLTCTVCFLPLLGVS